MLKIDIQKELYGASGLMNFNIDVQIKNNSFTVITGSSGSGKTTLLRTVAGLEHAHGTIEFNNQIWLKDNTSISIQKRNIGFVFQDYALFPNMNVEENLLYVKHNKTLASKLLEITGLQHFAKRLPNTLSGGQKQRVSICRALMNKPNLLLLDEPFSALDPDMRQNLQDELLILHNEFSMTTIMVSHEPSEIYHLANDVIVLEKGKIIHQGTAKDVLLHTLGSQKFSFNGKVVDILEIDVIFIAIVAIGQHLVEIVLSQNEQDNLYIGQKVQIGTKAFHPFILPQ